MFIFCSFKTVKIWFLQINFQTAVNKSVLSFTLAHLIVLIIAKPSSRNILPSYTELPFENLYYVSISVHILLLNKFGKISSLEFIIKTKTYRLNGKCQQEILLINWYAFYLSRSGLVSRSFFFWIFLPYFAVSFLVDCHSCAICLIGLPLLFFSSGLVSYIFFLIFSSYINWLVLFVVLFLIVVWVFCF